MAVQILIHRSNGKVVFDPPDNPQQSDLLFWHNQDGEAHFPVPGCTNLLVGPGQSTSAAPYQPFPDTTSSLPLTIDYVCALHNGEGGTMIISADPAPPLPGSAPIDPAAVPIPIRRSGDGVIFGTVDVAQGDTVYWQNHDTNEHWPVPNCTGLLVPPGKSSNSTQPATANFPRSPNLPGVNPYSGPAPLPMALTYGCAIPGHEGETGTINVYDNMAAAPLTPAPQLNYPPLPPTVLQVGLPIIIVTGGKSPYTIVQDTAYPQLTLVEMEPAGSSSGVAVVLNAAPTQSSLVPLNVQVTDGLGKTLKQVINVCIQGPTA
jgi:hypothetical protein